MDSPPAPESSPAPDDGLPTQKFSPSLMHGLLAAGAQTPARHEWQPPSVEDLQRLLPQYEISDFIARGGMGAVYKGVQKTLKRPVAIKVLPPEADDGDLQYAERFKREAQAMARLSHPNIVAVYDAGEVRSGGTPAAGIDIPQTGGRSAAAPEATLLYFVMEYIEGTDLHQLISSEKQIDARRAVTIITAVCDALAFAHEEGIIHRDIKPSNIMIDRKGRVKVADFGLAKSVHVDSTMLTRSDVSMGTPDFVAPEATVSGITLDQRADLYAVGVMLYQMLTGHIPRGRFSPISAVVPKTDPKLDAIVDKAMQTDREKRYSTATELKKDVESVGNSGFSPSGSASEDGLKPELRTKRRAPLLIGAAVTVIVLVAGAFFLTRKDEKGTAAARPAASPTDRALASATTLPLPSTPWRLPDGPPGFVKELVGAKTQVRGVKVLPDGKRLLSIGGMTPDQKPLNEVILWDVETGKPLWTRNPMQGQGSLDDAIAILPQQKMVVVLARDTGGTLLFLDLETGAIMKQVPVGMDGLSARAFMAVSADGQKLAVALSPTRKADGDPLRLQIHDARGDAPVLEWEIGHSPTIVRGIAWVDHQRVIVTVGQKTGSPIIPAQILVHGEVKGSIPEPLPSGVAGNFFCVPVPGKPGQFIAHDSNRLMLYDAAGHLAGRKVADARGQRSLHFLDATRLLGLGEEGGATTRPLHLWDMETGAVLWKLEDPRVSDAIDAIPEGSYAVTNMRDVKTGQSDTKLAIWRLPQVAASGAAGTNPAKTALAGASALAKSAPKTAYHPPPGPAGLAKTWDFPQRLTDIALVQDDRRLLYSEYGTPRMALMDLASGDTVWEADVNGANALLVLPSGQQFIRLGHTGVAMDARLVEVEDARHLAEWTIPYRPTTTSSPTCARAVSPDGRHLCIACQDRLPPGPGGGSLPPARTKVWVLSTDSLKLVAEWEVTMEQLYSAAWLDGQRFLLSTARPEALLAFDLRKPGDAPVPHLARLRSFVAADPAGKFLVGSQGAGLAMVPLTGDRKPVVLHEKFGARAMCFGENGLLAALEINNRDLTIFDVRRGSTVAEFHVDPPGTGQMLMSRDGSFALTKENKAQGDKTMGQVSLWRLPQVAAATPDSFTKDAPFVNSLGMKFVPVPITGGPTDKQRVLFSIWETRVQDYEVFAKETKREWPKPPFEQGPTHPAGRTNWDDAHAFCSWLTERERKEGKIGAADEYRLPSDHEWSCAAGIGEMESPLKTPHEKNSKVQSMYPWGTVWPPPLNIGNYRGEETKDGTASQNPGTLTGYRDGFPKAAPVGSFAANKLGLFDLGGNVFEWCEDWRKSEPDGRVGRGASFTNGVETELRSSTRSGFPPSVREDTLGFRVVLSVGDSSAAKGPSWPHLPSAEEKKLAFTNTLGMKFVPVPGTEVLFCIHETRRQDYAAYAAETEGVDISWKQATHDKMPAGHEDNHPVVSVSWEDAHAFCAWLSKKEGRRYRLPKDREWSFAVGIGAQESTDREPAGLSQRVAGHYPWGTTWPPTPRVANLADKAFLNAMPVATIIEGYEDGFATTAPVMSFPANAFGIHDLGGNVWEWCEDVARKDRADRIGRGGGFDTWKDVSLLSSYRVLNPPDYRNDLWGFRIVAETQP